jgi:CheY-like chemotaxis protein
MEVPLPHIVLLDAFREEAEMYGEYLRAVGFDVELHRDAGDAIAAVGRRRPDVFVTRLRQRHQALSGIEIVDHVKRMTAPPVPVVMLTTSMLASDREAAERAHCDAYLLLPVVPDQLAHRIRQLVPPADA